MRIVGLIVFASMLIPAAVPSIGNNSLAFAFTTTNHIRHANHNHAGPSSMSITTSISTCSTINSSARLPFTLLHQKKSGSSSGSGSGSGSDDEEEDDIDIDISNRDWRAFRAQLVMGKDNDSNGDDDADDDAESTRGDGSNGKNSKNGNGNTLSNADTNISSNTNANTNTNNNDSSTTTTAATATTPTDNMMPEAEQDLDGIGSIFTNSQSKSSPPLPRPMTAQNFTPLPPSQWAYDQGHLIEQGAVILGGVEQDYGHTFGLRQQYFHKVVILVLDHDEGESGFTKGIILNRPTDHLVEDEFGERWRIWFGGDVQNLDSPMPDIVCIHTLPMDQKFDGDGSEDDGDSDGDDNGDNSEDDDNDSNLLEKVSTTVIQNIQRVSFTNAQKLVQKGLAQPSDFWCFAGYAGWGPSQLASELNRKSWYMCATDSQTLLTELAKQSAYMDPRDGGLDTWELLMGMIGRGETAVESSGDFEDLMLKEWARAHLLSSVSVEAGGSASARVQKQKQASASVKADADSVNIGSLLRASSGVFDRSPYLLDHQEFHKSIVLVIGDDANTSVGLILNQPSSKGIEMDLVDRNTAEKRSVDLPVRFGGQYAIRGMSTLQWLHLNPDLREAKVGRPVGPKIVNDDENIGDNDDDDAIMARRHKEEIWQCSQEDATSAISAGLAKPNDFLLVSGISVWIKEQRGAYQGLKGEVKNGKFEVIPQDNVGHVWDVLRNQTVLTKMNLIQNLNHGNEAWKVAGAWKDGGDTSSTSRNGDEKENDDVPVTGGIGEEYDEEDDRLVFKSDVRVAKLSDDALQSWIATFLLGAPSLGA
jgi:putative AlgH/UPF0301 family transcriptional regulator